MGVEELAVVVHYSLMFFLVRQQLKLKKFAVFPMLGKIIEIERRGKKKETYLQLSFSLPTRICDRNTNLKQSYLFAPKILNKE